MFESFIRKRFFVHSSNEERIKIAFDFVIVTKINKVLNCELERSGYQHKIRSLKFKLRINIFVLIEPNIGIQTH
jgi:hypothetical protein